MEIESQKTDRNYSSGSKLYAFFRLARPLNGLIAFISVVMGAFFAKGSIDPPVKVATIAFAAFLLLSAGNAVNDFCDVEADRVNKPGRPIPSGRIKRRNALIFAIVLFVIGTGLGLLVNRATFAIAFMVSVFLVLYTLILRRLLLVGNVVIGILTGLTFISGGVAVGAIGGAIIPAIFACLFNVAREVVKDIQDVKGDDIGGLSSLATRLGQRRAMYVAFVFLALVIVLSPFPYFLNIYSLYYLICVVLGVDLVLACCIFILLFNLTERNAARVASIMKFDIFVGLGAIYLGGIH
jgi:geranylgeranylglycerol-phosphate geranylgeranyltransferase